MVGCIKGGKESEYRDLVRKFVEWSEILSEFQQDKRDGGRLLEEKKTCELAHHNIMGEDQSHLLHSKLPSQCTTSVYLSIPAIHPLLSCEKIFYL